MYFSHGNFDSQTFVASGFHISLNNDYNRIYPNWRIFLVLICAGRLGSVNNHGKWRKTRRKLITIIRVNLMETEKYYFCEIDRAKRGINKPRWNQDFKEWRKLKRIDLKKMKISLDVESRELSRGCSALPFPNRNPLPAIIMFRENIWKKKHPLGWFRGCD